MNAEKIKQQLAEAEQRHAEILAKANAEAQKMIDEARASAGASAERKQQEAIAAAEQILAKAREASAIEHERTMSAIEARTRPARCRYDGESDRQSTDAGRSTAFAGGSEPRRSHPRREATREDQQGDSATFARDLLRASFVDGALDRGQDRLAGRVVH